MQITIEKEENLLFIIEFSLTVICKNIWYNINKVHNNIVILKRGIPMKKIVFGWILIISMLIISKASRLTLHTEEGDQYTITYETIRWNWCYKNTTWGASKFIKDLFDSSYIFDDLLKELGSIYQK